MVAEAMLETTYDLAKGDRVKITGGTHAFTVGRVLDIWEPEQLPCGRTLCTYVVEIDRVTTLYTDRDRLVKLSRWGEVLR